MKKVKWGIALSFSLVAEISKCIHFFCHYFLTSFYYNHKEMLNS
jgi:hypothetical protein